MCRTNDDQTPPRSCLKVAEQTRFFAAMLLRAASTRMYASSSQRRLASHIRRRVSSAPSLPSAHGTAYTTVDPIISRTWECYSRHPRALKVPAIRMIRNVPNALIFLHWYGSSALLSRPSCPCPAGKVTSTACCWSVPAAEHVRHPELLRRIVMICDDGEGIVRISG